MTTTTLQHSNRFLDLTSSSCPWQECLSTHSQFFASSSKVDMASFTNVSTRLHIALRCSLSSHSSRSKQPNKAKHNFCHKSNHKPDPSAGSKSPFSPPPAQQLSTQPSLAGTATQLPQPPLQITTTRSCPSPTRIKTKTPTSPPLHRSKCFAVAAVPAACEEPSSRSPRSVWSRPGTRRGPA